MTPPIYPASAADLAIVRAYHRRSKHRFDAYAPGPEALDWDAQPAPFRHFAGAPSFVLPRLSEQTPGSSLDIALQRPFATLGVTDGNPRGTADTPILPPRLDSIAALLQLSLGITAWKSLGPDRWALRANPSSGNLHPTEAYLWLSAIDGLADGLYHYRPEDHALELRARHVVVSAAVPRLAILLSSAMWREAWKYGERAFRYCQLDIGHAAAALRYAAGMLGWRLTEQPQLGSATLARFAGLDRMAEFPARRHVDTEREEPEILLAVSFFNTPPDAPDASDLHALADTATWHGVASTLDAHPMYQWPAINEVAAASRCTDGMTTAGPAPMPVANATSATAIPSIPVANLLSGRRSAQRFDGDHVMPFDAFASLVDRLHPVAGLPWDSLGDVPRVALLCFIHRVEGLEPGLYLLPRSASQLADLRPRLNASFEFASTPGVAGLLRLGAIAPVELRRLARSLHCHQDIAATACFALGMLADFDAALDVGPAAYRALFRECGLIGQVLYLEAELRGLRGTGIGCFFDDPVHDLLGLKDEAWQSLYHFTVGLPLLDTRIETAAGYTAASPS